MTKQTPSRRYTSLSQLGEALGQTPDEIAAQDRAEAALRDVRETVRGIRPAVLSERGLAPALKDLTGRAPLPTSVVVGRGLKDGLVEIRDRRSSERRDVAVADVVAQVLDEVRG